MKKYHVKETFLYHAQIVGEIYNCLLQPVALISVKTSLPNFGKHGLNDFKVPDWKKNLA